MCRIALSSDAPPGRRRARRRNAQLPDPVRPDPNSPRPIAAVDSVFIEDLTWMEVRDAMQAGKDTVLVATGGVEQNGPYLVTGKHNVVLRGTTEAIARKLGNTLVAPIVQFVPEGDIDPPTSHMLYPGTISLREETYQALLTDICASLKAHGFKRIVLIGDSGGNQDGMQAVAAALSAKWKGACQIVFIREYYNAAPVNQLARRARASSKRPKACTTTSPWKPKCSPSIPNPCG